ncbi:carboxylesterase [Immersiella caudata]|uniref:Carboxylic ester hydrolase n=1 Tax=Immersiella caudata TaxID=314043 RepID=A0AA39TXC3_9PEZI|nr:carboxylesterase [Immersiella caudata]
MSAGRPRADVSPLPLPLTIANGFSPASVNFETNILGNEDCLFLNVYSPKNASKLPVVVWIHGGGYGLGSANSFDFNYIGQTVDNGFVAVAIQYRLGAFGFLSSAEVAKHGTVNAGVYDMHFALQWVQKYISRFGGDPDQVTITGESAGGGSVMLMAMANGGTEGTKLFRRGISSSPYYPTQPEFDGGMPTDYYLQFARRAGCLEADEAVPTDGSLFKCLEKTDTIALQNASAYTSYAAKASQWAFIPVTDGKLIREQPTEQLLAGKVNGERMLAGANANEGRYFVPNNITTADRFLAFIRLNWPGLSPSAITSVLAAYAFPDNITAAHPRFDTDGLHFPFATSVSGAAVSWQQAAYNLYGETTFVCPAYWLADAYTSGGPGKKAWRYQVSTPNAFHGVDVGFLTGDPIVTGATGVAGEEFRRGFQEIWGRFIVSGDPTLAVTASGTAAASEDRWRVWGQGSTHDMLNLNVTQGTSKADWSVVDALKFEDGRGERCALWAKVGVR